MDKHEKLIETLYTLYGGSGLPIIVQSTVDSGTLVGPIASIEVREDATRITELYEEDNDTNLITQMKISTVDLVKGIDTFTNGRKGFVKVVCGAGSLKVNMKS